MTKSSSWFFFAGDIIFISTRGMSAANIILGLCLRWYYSADTLKSRTITDNVSLNRFFMMFNGRRDKDLFSNPASKCYVQAWYQPCLSFNSVSHGYLKVSVWTASNTFSGHARDALNSKILYCNAVFRKNGQIVGWLPLWDWHHLRDRPSFLGILDLHWRLLCPMILVCFNDKLSPHLHRCTTVSWNLAWIFWMDCVTLMILDCKILNIIQEPNLTVVAGRSYYWLRQQWTNK